MQVKEINPEVFFATEQIVKIGSDDLAFLKERAEQNQRGRGMLCAHRDIESKLHEIILVLRRDAYIRPDKHLTKVESYHIIEGVVDVVIFDEVGTITEVVQMGEYLSGRRFFYRLSDPYYHTLIIKSDLLVFHLTTTGPFLKSDTVLAPWAPEDADSAGRKEFMGRLERAVEGFLSHRGAEKTVDESISKTRAAAYGRDIGTTIRPG